jgi:hypothetical protein
MWHLGIDIKLKRGVEQWQLQIVHDIDNYFSLKINLDF